MCSSAFGPAIIGTVGSIMEGAGNQLAIQNQYKSDLASAAGAKYNAYLEVNNARMADEQSRLIGEKAGIDRRNIDYRTQMERNQGRASFAGSGVDVNSGSALEWEADLDQGAALEKASVTSDAEQARWALEVEKQSHLANAMMYYQSYGNLKSAANMGFWASTLGNVGQQGQNASKYWGSFAGSFGSSSASGGGK